MSKKEIIVSNVSEEHNNPIAELVQVACRFDSEIILESDNRRINAKSIMGIMAFNPSKGMTVNIEANGEDEQEALVKEAAVKSAPAKESVKETVAETKAAAEAKAAAVAKEVEKKVAETKETVKDTAKKATEKVEAATKTVVKKAAAKKAAPKKEELKPEVFIQFQGQEAVVAEVIEKAKKQFEAEGHRASSIKSIQVYLKPEEYAAYYVINQKHAGRVDLF